VVDGARLRVAVLLVDVDARVATEGRGELVEQTTAVGEHLAVQLDVHGQRRRQQRQRREYCLQVWLEAGRPPIACSFRF